jgi:hypothetical protein
MQATNPEPTGNGLQIYPTGIYDDFPDAGITIAFGPELRQHIEDVWSRHCDKKPAEECRNAVSSALSTSDVTTHVKRFVVVDALTVFAVISIVGQAIWVFSHPPSREMRFGKEALHQISHLAEESTFAVITDATVAPATITVQSPVISTPTYEQFFLVLNMDVNSLIRNFISVETLTAAVSDHRVGDVLHRIPQHTAERIQDFLGMTGLQETQRICKGQNMKRADTTECAQRILRHAIDLADTRPGGFMQLA